MTLDVFVKIALLFFMSYSVVVNYMDIRCLFVCVLKCLVVLCVMEFPLGAF